MRMKRNRVNEYHLRKVKTVKDGEGGTYKEYGSPIAFAGEIWPAGGKVQSQMYGERLSYIRNVKVEGNYTIEQDDKGVTHYVFPDGLDIVEGDGLCLYAGKDAAPDYRVISITPYRPLKMEAERLI